MLKGKTALITGSTSGIGQGIAEALAARGANIVLNGFARPDEIERSRSRIAQEHGVSVRYDGADMSKPDAIAAMIAKAIAEFGAIDVLVNNAGIQHVAPVAASRPAAPPRRTGSRRVSDARPPASAAHGSVVSF